MLNEQELFPARSWLALFLGGTGGIFGIVESLEMILHPFKHYVGFSGLDIGIELLNISPYFTVPAAVIAVIGASLAVQRLRTSGIILVSASLVGMLGSLVPVALAVSTPFTCCPISGVAFPGFLFFITEITIWWWDAMILLGGVAAFYRLRKRRAFYANLRSTTYA